MPEGTDKNISGVQGYMSLDLWMALDLDPALFDDYMQRNGFANTWAELLARVRVLAKEPRPCFVNDWCVMFGGHFGPCQASDDVGTSEPLPRPQGGRVA